MAKRPLKLYVWEGVFCDYYPGIAFAIAPDIRTARRLIADQYPNRQYATNELAHRPQIFRLDEHTQPRGWQLSGGG